MTTQVGEYVFDDDKKRLQLDVVHGWLKETYWSKGIPKSTVAAALETSLCMGIYQDKAQVGFARVVTDVATFAWICDVIVDEPHRGRGLSKELMRFVMAHPHLQGLRRICLATKDAHELYKKFGFKITETPQNWMEIKNNAIYLERST